MCTLIICRGLFYMTSIVDKNKRIAKNTLMLYIRMLFLMLVNLYTSRVVLQALGIEDYGVYNAVAGFIALFSMVSNSISGAISRFLTFVLGLGDQMKLNKVFSTALIIQITIALIVVALVEIVGVWFLNTHMTIPDNRILAANCVLQLTLLTFVFNLWSTPYNAAIIAHEKMSAFAYIGIFDGCAKLSVAFLIWVSPIDNLIFYTLLMSLIALATRILYTLYCKRNFEECHFKWVLDKNLFKEMFSFAGWNFIGCISGVLLGQGINLLYNVYLGPVVNAARGLASQVQAAVGQFSDNFFTAVQPQITKSFAGNQLSDAHTLVFRSSRLGFLLMMALVIPIVSETEYILGLWLKEVPKHTASFIQIILLDGLFCSFSQPLIKMMLATGKIKKYQILVGSANLLNFPVAWLVWYFTGNPEFTQMTLWFFSLIVLMLRLFMLKETTNFPVVKFLNNTVFRCMGIFVVCILPALLISFSMEDGLVRFLLNIVMSEVIILLLVCSFGLNQGERQFVFQKINYLINRKK